MSGSQVAVGAVLAALGTDAMRTDIAGRLATGVAEDWQSLIDSGASEFEHGQAMVELFNLGKGADCHYDTPAVSAHYAIWYSARRIQDAARALVNLMCRNHGDLELLDLGAGSGATWIAVWAIERAREQAGGRRRKVTITAVDSSAVMLRTGRTIWKHFEAEGSVAVATRAAGWTHPVETGPDPIVVASYLFDHSDAARPNELAEHLHAVLDGVRATRCVLITAPNKTTLTRSVVSELTKRSSAWHVEHGEVARQFWQGPVRELSGVRSHSVAVLPPQVGSQTSSQPPTWHEPGTLNTTTLRRDEFRTLDVDGRIHITLDTAQDEAARPDGRMTEILGAAGSGKSRVLIERLVRTVEAAVAAKQHTSVLVTTFNIDLLEQLHEWFLEAIGVRPVLAGLDDPRTRSGGRGDRVVARQLGGKVGFEVRFLNWDKMPPRLFNVKVGNMSDGSLSTMEQLVRLWQERDATGSRQKWLESRTWCTPEFVAAEINRVVFGQEVVDLETYQELERQGRGRSPAIRKHSNDRKQLWSLMVEDRSLTLFVDARSEMIRRIRRRAVPAARFDHLFIDEGQDLLPVEFECVLPALVKDLRSVVVAADPNQAMHTGASFTRPGQVRERFGGPGRRWTTHRLSGSYRLPIWVAEALRPLAVEVRRRQENDRTSSRAGADADVDTDDLIAPNAMKNSVLGVRPIIVAAETYDEFARVLAQAVETHRELLPGHQGSVPVTFAEADKEGVRKLQHAVSRVGGDGSIRIESASMRRIKGLERPVVAWRTRDTQTDMASVSPSELVYTALTRTTFLLVIGIVDGTDPRIARLVGCLDPRHLRFWDERSRTMFQEWRSATVDGG